METCTRSPRGSPFHLPAELAVGLDPGSDPRNGYPPGEPRPPACAEGVRFPRAPIQEGTRTSATDLASVLHDTTVIHTGTKSIPQGLKHRELPHPQ